MRVVAQGAIDRKSREIHLMLAHVVYWQEAGDVLTLVLVTGDTFLVAGEERERLRARLLGME